MCIGVVNSNLDPVDPLGKTTVGLRARLSLLARLILIYSGTPTSTDFAIPVRHLPLVSSTLKNAIKENAVACQVRHQEYVL